MPLLYLHLTRYALAYPSALAFNISNKMMFNIGIFPYAMLASLVLFLPPCPSLLESRAGWQRRSAAAPPPRTDPPGTGAGLPPRTQIERPSPSRSGRREAPRCLSGAQGACALSTPRCLLARAVACAVPSARESLARYTPPRWHRWLMLPTMPPREAP